LGRKRKFKGICPRCGEPFSYIKRNKRGNRVYLYAVHYIGVENGKKKIRQCYLGAEDGYVYVTKLHSDLGLLLKGLHDKKRVFEYFTRLVEDIIEGAKEGKYSKEDLIRVKNCIQRIINIIDNRIKQTS